MRAKAKLLSIEAITGKSKKTGNDYAMNICNFLDLDTFDKMRLTAPDSEAKTLSQQVGKDGFLDVGFDARTEKLSFVAFKVAPAAA